jgi:hypothetical protein
MLSLRWLPLHACRSLLLAPRALVPRCNTRQVLPLWTPPHADGLEHQQRLMTTNLHHPELSRLDRKWFNHDLNDIRAMPLTSPAACTLCVRMPDYGCRVRPVVTCCNLYRSNSYWSHMWPAWCML